MSVIYFVRHGETVWNAENKICGATDSPLTERGHRQAVETAEKIRKMGIKADMILYSPLSRARDTAMHIAEITGIPAGNTLQTYPHPGTEHIQLSYPPSLSWTIHSSLSHCSQAILPLIICLPVQKVYSLTSQFFIPKEAYSSLVIS